KLLDHFASPPLCSRPSSSSPSGSTGTSSSSGCSPAELLFLLLFFPHHALFYHSLLSSFPSPLSFRSSDSTAQRSLSSPPILSSVLPQHTLLFGLLLFSS